MIIIADKYKIHPHSNSNCWVLKTLKVSKSGREYWTDTKYPDTLSAALRKVRQRLLMDGFGDTGSTVQKVEDFQEIVDNACKEMSRVIQLIGEKEMENLTNKEHIEQMLEYYRGELENYDNHDYYLAEDSVHRRIKELEEELEKLEAK